MPFALLMSAATDAIFLTIAADTTSYNAYVAAGSPGVRKDVYITIAPGVKVGQFTTGTGWATGTIGRIVNHGYITGAGGGFSGADGGAALDLRISGWYIDNTDGYILGGGGQGAYGQPAGAGVLASNGGGGGGGQGYPGGFPTGQINNGGAPAGDGTAGSFSGPGSGGPGGVTFGSTGGEGGAGGTWGSPGNIGTRNSEGFINTNVGLPGRAIAMNGHSFQWLGGYNSTQVKGAVS